MLPWLHLKYSSVLALLYVTYTYNVRPLLNVIVGISLIVSVMTANRGQCLCSDSTLHTFYSHSAPVAVSHRRLSGHSQGHLDRACTHSGSMHGADTHTCTDRLCMGYWKTPTSASRPATSSKRAQMPVPPVL